MFNIKEFRPMLAVDCDLDKLRFPVVSEPKYDGVRCYIHDGVVYSRTKKRIPNEYVQQTYGIPKYEGLEGELVLNGGKCSASDVSSVVMSKFKVQHVDIHLFDRIARGGYPWFGKWPVKALNSRQEVLDFYEECLGEGYEGIILRDPAAPYKFGRSTMKDQGLMRMKPWADAEAIVIGFETMRSETKGYQLGALTVKGINAPYKDVVFSVGTGFSESQRVALLKEPLEGKIVKYKFMAYGGKELPRMPVFIGFRSLEDM